MDQLMRDGDLVTFEDVGKGAPPVLLIHDPGYPPASMAGQLARLRERHRVVLPDLRSRSRSRSLQSQSEAGDAAEVIAWLCYELGVYRPVAIGDRLGGRIAFELASSHPDLLAAIVTLATPVEFPEGKPRAGQRIVPWLRIETQMPAVGMADESGERHPGAVTWCVSVEDLRPGGATVEALVDAFVSGLGASELV